LFVNKEHVNLSLFRIFFSFLDCDVVCLLLWDGFSARRGRIYLPLDELAQAGLTEEDIFRGKVTDKWRRFMKGQIQRARLFFDEAEKGVAHLDSASRWPVREPRNSVFYLCA
jgi:hypothetical protein